MLSRGNIHPRNDERMIRNASKEKKHEQRAPLAVNDYIFIDNTILFSKSTVPFRQDCDKGGTVISQVLIIYTFETKLGGNNFIKVRNKQFTFYIFTANFTLFHLQ